MKISIIVPVFNEQATIQQLVTNIIDAMCGYTFELLIIDDASTDTIRETIQQIENKNVTLVSFQKNYGQSAAIMAGIENSSGEVIILIDGDLQNDPYDIPKLFQKLSENKVDLVQGVRQSRKDNWSKVIPSRVANLAIRLLFQVPIHDIGCSIKAFNRTVAKDLIYFNGFHRFIPLVVHLKGYKLEEMNVNHRNRIAGYSKYGIERIFIVIKHLIYLRFFPEKIQEPKKYLIKEMNLKKEN